LKPFIYPTSETFFNVDAYIVTVMPKEDPRYHIYQLDKAYWLDAFTKTRRNRAGNKLLKGFLEIVF